MTGNTTKQKNKQKNAKGVKMHCYMWVGGNETSEHSGSFDLNPKKEIQCVEKRDNFSNGSKLTIKMYIWI